MIRTIFTSAAVMTLMASATAQSQFPSGSIQRSTTPNHGTYSMTTGFELSTFSYRSGPATIFDNTDGDSIYFTTMTDSSEYVDEMAFAATDLDGDEQINGVTFNYCSGTPDSGTMDAVTTELRFYNDTILGLGPTGWLDLGAGTNQNATCAYALIVPGDTTGIGVECWSITIDLECGAECSLPQELTPGGFTELNGMGWMYRDATASGASGPNLDSLTTAAGGPFSAIPGYGSQDYFEWFDLAAGLGSEYQGAFFFGGSSKLQASFETILYGNGVLNTDSYSADMPEAGDVLCLTTDTEFDTGAAVTWSLADPATAGVTYFVAGSLSRVDNANGMITRLVGNPISTLPVMMTGSPPMYTEVIGPGAWPTVYAQAYGVDSLGAAIEASNGLEMN